MALSQAIGAPRVAGELGRARLVERHLRRRRPAPLIAHQVGGDPIEIVAPMRVVLEHRLGAQEPVVGLLQEIGRLLAVAAQAHQVTGQAARGPLVERAEQVLVHLEREVPCRGVLDESVDVGQRHDPITRGGTGDRRREEPQTLRKAIRQDSRSEEPDAEGNGQDADGEERRRDLLDDPAAGVEEADAAGSQNYAGLQRQQDPGDGRAGRRAEHCRVRSGPTPGTAGRRATGCRP